MSAKNKINNESKKTIIFELLTKYSLRKSTDQFEYVHGYIETLQPPGKEKLVGADASHAWFSVLIPGFGWIDFDPTNNQIPKNQHIIVSWGRDYYDVPPLKGVIYSTGKNKMKVAVDIRPVDKI